MQKFKRVLAFLLSFVMIISSVNLTSALTVQAAEDTETQALEGSGTQADPWLISDAEDFVLMSSLISSDAAYADDYYQMTNDIDFTDVTMTAIGKKNHFSGVFDGQLYAVRNLTLTDTTDNTGLFAYVENGVVTNLGVEDSTITGGNKTGALIGRTLNAVVLNCYSTNTTVSGKDSTGGIAGMFNSSQMYNCYSDAKVSGTSSVGGICGALNSSLNLNNLVTVDNVYSTAKVSGSSYCGGIVGWDEGHDRRTPVNVSNAYYYGTSNASGNNPNREATLLTEAQITDGTLVDALNANVRNVYAKWTQEEGSAPKFATFEMTLTGEGTKDSPYLIEDVADFLEMAEAVNASPYYAGAYYQMENSLDLKDVDITGIASANPFGGTFDGAGHVLKNVNISNGSTNYTGLFCKVEGGTIKNLGIESGTIKGGYYVGGFAGYAEEAAIINCFNGAEIFGYSCVGGLAGKIQDSHIYNSFNKGLIRITYKSIGGLAGSVLSTTAGATTIRNSYNIGQVNVSTDTGHIIGTAEENVVMENVYYAADMPTKNQPIGNFIEFSGITGKTKAELMSETFVETLNANVQEGDQKWVYGADHIARFADFEEAAKLDVFMESIDTVTIKDNKVQSIVSSDGAYKTVVYGSNNTNVIDLDGNVYQPLTAQTVLLILDIVDTETGEVVKQLNRNVEVTIEGKYADSGSNEVPNVVPGLREWYGLEGNFTVTENTKIVAATGEMKDLAVRIQTYMKDMIGLELEVTEGTGSEGDIVLNYAPERSAELQEEGYEIEISDQIVIEAATETGMFYGAVSIMQILYQDETKTNVPKGYIRDYPEYELRGGMLDAGRKYFALDYVEEIGKYMSWFKMNTLHLHINEGSGEFGSAFVLESKKYPAVNGNNGEYVWSQDDYRQMQKELKTFGVNVITEIDSPGHAGAFGLIDSSLVSGGSLNLKPAYYDKSLGLIEKLFDEFLDGEDPVIQNAIVHIGTDEASGITTEVMRSYISDLSQYVLAKDNVDKVVFWGNLGLYYGQTEIDSENVAAQIWDAVDYRADEALASGFDLINSTSDQLYLTIARNNKFGLGSYKNAYVDLALFYDTWKGASDFTTNNLVNPHKLSRGTYLYSEHDILKGNPKVLGAEFCNWNDGKYGFTYDVMEVMTPYIAGMAEKCWYGDTDRFETGEEFVEAFNKVGSHAPYANPKYAVDSDGKEVAAYDFDEMTDGMVKDSVNGYDAVVTNGTIETSDGNGVLKLDGTTSVTLPFKGVGYPYTATFDIYLDGTQSQDAVLFSCDACTIYLDYENNGVSFQSDIYTYTFNVDIPTDQWVEVKLTSQMPCRILDSTNTTVLTINGTEYKPTKVGGTSKTSNTTILGTEAMFTGIVGSIDNLCIANTFSYNAVLDNYQYEGEGTEASPYLIQTAEDLRMFPMYLNAGLYQDAYFKLTADIDMAGVAYTTAGEFYGTLDGDGYKITNLTISAPSTDYVGLIGYLNKGTIKNLGIEESTITGSQKVGALAGRTMNATVMNCYSKATVSGKSDVGGLIGQFNSSYMYNCYSAATVTATSSGACAGGLAGSMNTSLDKTTPVTVDNVYSVATVTCPLDAGAITGWCESFRDYYPAYFTNVYYCDSEKNAIGNARRYVEIIGSYDEATLGDFTKYSDETALTDGTLLTALNENLADGYETWVKDEDGYPCFRRGTEDSPYLIQTAEDLKQFAASVNAGLYKDAYFKFTADIDMTDVEYTMASEFNGTLDGDGHKITNLTISASSTSYVGLISYLKKGTIKNLGIEDSTITGSLKVGALAGRALNATVMNCYSKATVSGKNDVGGLVGQFNSSYMYNCYSAADVTATNSGSCAGGLTGSMNTSLDKTTPVKVDNVYSIATVTCPTDGGVITGWCEGYNEATPVYMTNVYYYDGEKTAIANTRKYTSYDETTLGITKLSSESALTDGTLLNALNGNLVDGYETWVKGEGNYPCFRNSLYDVSELEEALEKAAAIEKDNYTSETITELEKAVKTAEAALVPESQDQIDEAVAGLNAALAALELKDADYTAVDAALKKVNDLNRDLYTTDSLAKVDAAAEAVVRGKKIDEQSAVDAMAQAIEGALAVLAEKDANYTAVNAAKEKAAKLDRSLYTDESLAAVDAAVAAVVEGKKISEQTAVDAMAKAIEDAVTAVAEKDADYTAVDRALESVPKNMSVYTDETVKAVNDAAAAVIEGKKITEQETVDAWAEAIIAAVKGLQYKAAAYDAVNQAIEKVPEDLTIYTKESVDALNEAIAAVENDKDITEQETVDTWAKDILAAIDNLVEKDADYSKVEAAIAKVPADMSIYTDETVKAVTDAVAAVVKGKKVTEQSEVDAMAQAIEDAVAALEKIPEEPSVEEDEVVRIAGADRYETGFKVADDYKEALGVEKFDSVIIATGKNFADALSGSYLAIVKNAPILLTNGKADNVAQLHAYIAENLKEKGNVYILGGEAAVPASVEAGLEGYAVKRLAGESRYDTNLEILEEAGVSGTELLVATGKTFADSLSASATGRPILLVKPGAELTDAQKAVAAKVAGGTIYVLGGAEAVSEETANAFSVYGEVKRLSGADRYETSAAVAETFFGDAKAVVIASGRNQNFPDGLCGGPLAAALNVPLILTKDGQTEAATGYVAEHEVNAGYALGGESALTDETVKTVFGLKSVDEIIVK